MSKGQLRYLGPSSDYRTSRWEVTCPACERTFKPPTTMFGSEVRSCEKCGVDLLINYNSKNVSVREQQY